MKSWIVLLSVTMLSGAFFALILTGEDKVDSRLNLPRKIASKKPQNELSKRKNRPSTIDRKIAAISPPLKVIKAELVGITESELKNMPKSNIRSEKWEQKFREKFAQIDNSLQKNSIKITHKRSIIKKENKSARNFEHILVSYRLPNGNPYSFEALVDSESGTMKQSWNRTRYERRTPTKLDGTNKLMLRSN